MLNHIVLFKLTDSSPDILEKVKETLLSMEGKIPQLRYLEAGVDIVRSERSYDIALVTKFDSLQAMEEYQVHPVHLEVAKYIGSVRESAIVVDFYTD